MKDILNIITASSQGLSAGEIEKRVALSRPTINRRLKEALDAGLIIAEGQGTSREYGQ